MSKVRSNIMNRFQNKMKDKKTSLPLSVQRVFPVNKEVAKVLIRVPAAIQHRVNEAEIASAFEGMGLRYLPESFVRCHMENRELFTGLVSTKRKVMTDETASTMGLTEVASNVFTDDLDNVWDRQVIDGRPVFVCTAGDDVEEILKNYKETANVAAASLEVASTTSFIGGDGVYFYNPATETATFGIATGKGNDVYLPAEDKVQEVPGIMVLAAQAGRTASGLDVDDVLEYFRKLYGHNAEFYNKLRELIKSYLVV